MKLQWFRHHQKFVYWVLLPVVALTMGLFGISGALSKNSGGGGGGPSVAFRVGDSDHYLSPAQVLQLRTELTNYSQRRQTYNTDQAALYMVDYMTALHTGFEVGKEELKERLLKAVKDQISRHNETAPDEITEEIYNKLLQTLQLTPSQFEEMTHQMDVMGKMTEHLYKQSKASDPELFVKYCQEKETVRLRFQEIKSEDHLKDTKVPDENAIKKYYDDNKDNKEGGAKDILFTKPSMTADVFYYPTDKAFAEVKPTADDLQKYYDLHKATQWKEDPKPDAKPDDAPKFKPFDSVKADVEKQWGIQKKQDQQSEVSAKLGAMREDLKTALKKNDDDQVKVPEKDRKPFDVDAWAKSKGLTHWVTLDQNEEQYKAGKKELNAPDFASVERLFQYLNEPPPYFRNNQSALERWKKQIDDPTYPEALDIAKPEKGYAFAIKKVLKESAVKPLAECKDEIVKRLRLQESIELASKAAKTLHDDWAAGKNLPDVAKLDEVNADEKSKQPLAQEFYRTPETIGKVLEVASGPAEEPDESKPNATPKNLNERFYVGFAVERKLPTWDTFEKDTAWERDSNRRQVEESDFSSEIAMFTQQMKDSAKRIGDAQDPDIFESMRRGQSQE